MLKQTILVLLVLITLQQQNTTAASQGVLLGSSGASTQVVSLQLQPIVNTTSTNSTISNITNSTLQTNITTITNITNSTTSNGTQTNITAGNTTTNGTIPVGRRLQTTNSTNTTLININNSTINQTSTNTTSDANATQANATSIVTNGTTGNTTTTNTTTNSTTNGTFTNTTTNSTVIPTTNTTNTTNQTIPAQPSGWSYLYQNTTSSTTWVFPNSNNNTIIYSLGSAVIYQFMVSSDCPLNPAQLSISATSFFYVFLNNQLIFSGASMYPTLYKIALNLICGCNTIQIQVINNIQSSPLAIIYDVYQNVTGCYVCSVAASPFYNYATCSCACPDCTNSLMTIIDTTGLASNACGCQCFQHRYCPPQFQWNALECKCECPNICCSAGFMLDPFMCKCVAIVQKIQPSCPSGQTWSETLLQCQVQVASTNADEDSIAQP